MIHYTDDGKVDRGYWDVELADRCAELSDALDAANAERDELKTRLAGAEAALETDAVMLRSCAAMERKVKSLKHHIKALIMLAKAQHSPIDWPTFDAEVLAIDAALKDTL